jgi:hypothetical protein
VCLILVQNSILNDICYKFVNCDTGIVSCSMEGYVVHTLQYFKFTHLNVACTFLLVTVLRHVNPFQSNFSATRILPSSYLFWAGKRLVDSSSVLHEEKRRTGSDSGAGEQTRPKKCRTSSDIGAEQENHVGRGPTLDRKGLICLSFYPHEQKLY